MRGRLLRVSVITLLALFVVSGAALAVGRHAPATGPSAAAQAQAGRARHPGLRLVSLRLELVSKRLARAGESPACQQALSPAKVDLAAAQSALDALKAALKASDGTQAQSAAQALREKLGTLRRDLQAARTACGQPPGKQTAGAAKGELPQGCHDAFLKEREAMGALHKALFAYRHALAVKQGAAAAQAQLQSAESAQHDAVAALSAACGSG